MNKPLRESVIKTLAYFDGADYPLTRVELFRFLWQAPAADWSAFVAELDAMLAEKILETRWGFFFLPGRVEIVEARRRRLLESERKLALAKKAAKKIRAVPFLRAIFVCNTVAAGTAQAASDIDFFIVCRARRVWLVRFFCNTILRLLGLRTYGNKIKDRVCLSFFVGEDNLDLSGLRSSERDTHFAYWLSQMFPLYDPKNIYAEFLKANVWAGSLAVSARQDFAPVRHGVGEGWLGGLWKKIWEKFWGGAYGDLLESQMKKTQWQMIKPSAKERAGKNDNSVVFAPGVIKMHENDRRGKFNAEWQEKCARLTNIV